MKLKNECILCFGPSDWWSMNPSCAMHIMRYLSRYNQVIYVNPFSSDIFGMKNKKGLGKRILRKIKSLLKFYGKPSRNLRVLSPIFIPVQGRKFFDHLNDVFVRFQLKLVMKLAGFEKPVLWLENVRASDFIDMKKWELVVYHVSDKFDHSSYCKNTEGLTTRDRKVTACSDVIICVSNELYQWKKKSCKEVYYLPHGVDFEKFFYVADVDKSLRKIASLDHPVVGYFGTLTHNNDIELLEYCAGNLPHVNFVFAGQVTTGDYSRLKRMKNTFFTGRLPYRKIPQLCSLFDVCILPWKMTEWIKHCNPLKLFEYMASGKPIVSVPIREVATFYSDIVSVADNKEDFLRCILFELEYDTENRRQKRIEIANRNSWSRHIDKLSGLLKEKIEKQKEKHYVEM